MKTNVILLLSLMTISEASGQQTVRNVLEEGFGDLGTIKIRAEQGDVVAQLKLGDAYRSRLKSEEALQWYTAAAQSGSTEGKYQIGHLLLFGGIGMPQSQTVHARPLEGIRWTYSAATNGYAPAWRDMAKIRRTAIGCSTNLIEAYAWLGLLAEGSSPLARVEMNDVAIELSVNEIAEAKNLLANMKAGIWPPQPKAEVARPSVFLRLQSITTSPQGKLAIISNRTLAEGELTHLNIGGALATVRCLSIQSNSVEVQIEGETETRMLEWNPRN